MIIIKVQTRKCDKWFLVTIFLIFAEIVQNQNIKKLMKNSWNFVHIHFDEFFFDLKEFEFSLVKL